MKIKQFLSRILVLLMILQVCGFPAAHGAEDSGCPPHAKIETEYSTEVKCGTIRYISQNPEGDGFYWEYWPEGPLGHDGVNYYNSPRNECLTCCISMALSYVGVDYTPRAILERGRGHTYWDMWGLECEKSQSDTLEVFAYQMDRYLNGNGQYSPPIIHFPGYSAAGHYVLVIGKISDTEYELLDPWSRVVNRMTIADGTVSYSRHYSGERTYDRIDLVAQYYNPNGEISENSFFPAYCRVTATEEIRIMSLPFRTEAEPESRELAVLPAGDTRLATQLVENKFGELWYRVSAEDGTVGYIPAGKTRYDGCLEDDLQLYDYNTPREVIQGRSFSIWGSAASEYNRITELSAFIRPADNPEAEPITGGSTAVNAYYGSLSWVDSRLRFGILTPGDYLYTVYAGYKNCYAREDGTRGENFGEICLLTVPFTVVPPPDTTPGKPELQIRITDNTVTFTWEETKNTTHYNLWIDRRNADGQWESAEEIFYAASGVSRTLLPGEYRARLLSYNSEDWEEDGSDWKHTWGEDVFFSIDGHVPGDITGDGAVNNKDLTRLFRYLSGFDVEVNEEALDVTGDGSVNNKDVTRLFRFLSGFQVEIF